MMRLGIYDAHWKTMGGGEKLAASYAEALQDEYEVTLLAHEEISLSLLGAHLDVDLNNVRVQVIPDLAEAVSDASADFDVFINCSFLGSHPSRAARSFFVAMFPDRPAVQPTRAHDVLFDLRDVVLPQVARVHDGPGFYAEECDSGRRWRWTAAEAEFRVQPLSDAPLSVLLTVSGEHRPPTISPELFVDIDGTRHSRLLDRAASRTFVFVVRPNLGRDVTVRLTAEPFQVDGDPRAFGVQVLGVDVHRPAYEEMAEEILRVNHTHHSRKWMETYESVVSISEFTRTWVRNYWGRDSVVVYPAVRPRVRANKGRVILSVGRFSEDANHSKKQRELVAAFRGLLALPEAAGWELWLIGGATGEAYAESVRDAAEGLPVKIFANASGAEVAQALALASIYWHGMGIGENPHRDPVKFEHFGISIVEAMSAGAVPLVVGAGGQAEIVEDGISGLLFDSVDELVQQTSLLLRHPELREQYAEAAMARASMFTPEQFQRRVVELLKPSA